MSIHSVFQLPIKDPKAKILNFKFDEDFANIRYNLLGTGKLFTDTNFEYYLGDDKEWKRPKDICDRPVFVNGTPNRFDALQGGEGNCWLVTAMEAITFNPALIKHVVPRDQNYEHIYIGAFHFRIWQLGVWYDVVVDDRLPVYKHDKQLCYVRSRSGDVFWAALLEKAYAKISATSSPTYDSLNFGSGLTSLQDLSGGIVEVILTKDPPHSTLNWFLNKVYTGNALMTCYRRNEDGKSSPDIQTMHNYTITQVFKESNEEDPNYQGVFLIRLMNPWGQKEWKGDWSDEDYDRWGRCYDLKLELDLVVKEDGEFWMNEVDFVKNFDKIIICYLGPWQFIQSRGFGITTWTVSVFDGEWIKDVSAGGPDVVKRHMNPNYKISLKLPENEYNGDGLCTIVIQLLHRSKLGRREKPLVAVYVYSLNGGKSDQPISLDQNFFANVDPLNCNPDFQSSLGRTFVTTMKLEPGKYLLVPCTNKENKESRFLLRVFSEGLEETWAYNPKISKSMPVEEQSSQYFDSTLRMIFKSFAGDQKEIDSTDLKGILEEAINPKQSLRKGFTMFLEYICNVFPINISGQSSKNKETDRIVFTKDECRSMIAMLDDDQHSGRLSFPELSLLWDKISFWTKVYKQHRDDRDGYVKVSQLQDALGAIGYNITKPVVHSLSYLYADDHGRICLKDFILCGVKLETILDRFEQNYEEDNNKIMFSLQDWVISSLLL